MSPRIHAAPHRSPAPPCVAQQIYQWSRPIPTSLKVIHSRVYAQAITLGALGAVAAVEMYSQSQKSASEEE
jgi:hypothetical protein